VSGSGRTCPTRLPLEDFEWTAVSREEANKAGGVTNLYERKMRRGDGAIAFRVSTTLDGFGNEISML
jgi:hypothetical protein